MSNSLFDQLKKSGLVDDKKARKHKQEKHKSKKNKPKKGQAASADEATMLAQQAQANKLANDRLLNQQRKEQAERKALVTQINQLIESNKETQRDGEVTYNFTDGTLIKHLYVNETIHKQLSLGFLAIAKLNDSYELVPTPVAEKIKQRAPERIILCTTEKQPEKDEEDPYADYQIPDDLMW